MLRCIYVCLFLFSSLTFWGQKKSELEISTSQLHPLKLSDIAENSISLSLNGRMRRTQPFIYITDQYLYIAGELEIYQFLLSGKYMRTIECGDFVWGLAGDEWKHELYVPVSEDDRIVIRCYNETGHLLRKFPLDQSISACVYFENRLWMQQAYTQNDTVYYTLSNMDCQNGEISNFGIFHTDCYQSNFSVLSPACFSIVNGQLFFSINTDSILYQVRGDHFESYLQWSITPNIQHLSEKGILTKHFRAGQFVFIEYERIDPKESKLSRNRVTSYLYCRSVKDTSIEYNVQYKKVDKKDEVGYIEGVFDDLCGMGYIHLSPTNRQNSLYFMSEQFDLQTGKLKRNIHIIQVKE